ncbi:MAG TPA: dihydroneopterin aldolase [Gemmatimonadaceae bacterium]
MRTRDAISLRGMRFHARVGILPHERELPQPVEIDLTVWPAGRLGAGPEAIDYRALYEAAAGAIARELGYLEEVGEAIADRVLLDPRVRRARVAVRKPHVALAGPLLHAEVVVDRDRGA